MVASCVALTTLLTSPHEMAAHKKGARKDGTTGGVLATESRESRHALYNKMATSWGSTARGGHMFRTMDGRVLRLRRHDLAGNTVFTMLPDVRPQAYPVIAPLSQKTCPIRPIVDHVHHLQNLRNTQPRDHCLHSPSEQQWSPLSVSSDGQRLKQSPAQRQTG